MAIESEELLCSPSYGGLKLMSNSSTRIFTKKRIHLHNTRPLLALGSLGGLLVDLSKFLGGLIHLSTLDHGLLEWLTLSDAPLENFLDSIRFGLILLVLAIYHLHVFGQFNQFSYMMPKWCDKNLLLKWMLRSVMIRRSLVM